jgi:uncharacterized protein
MLKIGVFSDSHGDINSVKRAVKLMGSVDLIVHLGDFCKDAENVSKEIKREIISVKGNCDAASTVPTERIIEAGGMKFLLTHGHSYYVKSDYLNLYYAAVEAKVDSVLFGHTHYAEVFEKDNIIFINPGSLSKPMVNSATYAVVSVDSGFIVPNILELY